MKIRFLFLIFGIIFFSCGNKKGNIEIIRTAKVDTVKISKITNEETFVGVVKPFSEVNLSFKVAGEIKNIFVKEGDFVRKGTILAEIDSRDYQIQLSATEAEYNEIKSLTERVSELYKLGSATQNDYEKSTYGLEQISAKYKHHKDQLADTKLRSSTDGYVQNKFHEAGEIVAAGMPVISIVDNKELNIIINLPSERYFEKNKFEKFYAVFSKYKNLKIPLEFKELYPKSTAGQSFEMRFKILKHDSLNIAIGMAAEVYIIYKQPENQLITIPITAIFEENNNSYVWIFKTETEDLELREIKIFKILKNGTAIISSGLKEDEIFVSAGVHNIKKGMKVKVL